MIEKTNYKLFNSERLMPRLVNKKTKLTPLDDTTQMDLLWQAKTAWDNIAKYRSNRLRNRDYTFGKQWGDKVTTPDGREITEELYLKEQGKVPLKNNVIRQLVKNVVGQFRSNPTQPICVARDRDEQEPGEMMTQAVQYVHQLNKLSELDGRTMEEFLISGTCFHKVGYGWRNNKSDVWVDVVNPNRIFFSAMEDCRHWDCTLIGELHDLPIADVLGRFAGGSHERAVALRALYEGTTTDDIMSSLETLTESHISNLDFFMSAQPNLCRVIEVWRLESKERLKCHDTLTGEFFKDELSESQSIDAENRQRIADGAAVGVKAENVPQIEVEWYVDQYWHYRFFAPTGQVLDEGETPYWHGEHPYSLKLYPLIDGEIHSFVEDVIDQQRYINRLITMIDFIMGSSAKGVLLFPEDQIPDGMTIEDVAEEWTRYNGVILFRPRPGGMLPQQISSNSTNVGAYELLQLQMRLLDDISGVHGAMQGKTGDAGTPAALYAQQTMNGALNLLDIFESFRSFREERDIKIMKTLQQYYNDNRYLHLVGNNFNPQTARYDVEMVRDTEFDLSIVQSPTTSTYRAATNNLLLDLFKKGKISTETLLKLGAFPFADKLLAEIKEPQLPHEMIQK